MKNALVGYTGFVGSNLTLSSDFDGLFNSQNIEKAFGTEPDLLIYSGVRAEKFLANKEPKEDYEIIQNAIENIRKINPKLLVLISTIDVYKNPVDVDEDTAIDTNELHAYGLNRYLLEKWVEENLCKYLIVRLPGLYGKNIKKNFIYDMINVIPSMLNEKKYKELAALDSIITDCYASQNNGFYRCKKVNDSEKDNLKQFFNQIGFSTLNFTDSRGIFQFYNLSYLWKHINIALENNIKKLNISTEPVIVSELFEYIKGKKFINEISLTPPEYNFKSKYSDIFGGSNGYIFLKEFVMNDIKEFVNLIY